MQSAILAWWLDQFVRHRRRFRQDPEPAERIHAFISLDADAGTLAADAVKAVATGDEVAGDLVGNAVLEVGHARISVSKSYGLTSAAS